MLTRSARAQLRSVIALCLALLILVPTTRGWTQEPEQPQPKPEAAASTDVVPVFKGKAAPFTGMLVPEKRFTEFLRAELDAKQFKGELEIERKATSALETMYVKKLEQAVEPPKWYETPSFNRWLGFALGVVVTGAAVWGAVQLTK